MNSDPDVHDCDDRSAPCNLQHLAWRLWRVGIPPEHDPLLFSPQSMLPWPSDKPMIASCHRHGGRAPRYGCDCGIRVCGTTSALAKFMLCNIQDLRLRRVDDADDFISAIAVGSSLARGLIIRGGIGDTIETYRVERLAVGELFVPATLAGLGYAEALNSAYGVQVTISQLSGIAFLANFLEPHERDSCIVCGSPDSVVHGLCANLDECSGHRLRSTVMAMAGWSAPGITGDVLAGSRASARQAGGR